MDDKESTELELQPKKDMMEVPVDEDSSQGDGYVAGLK